MKFKSYLLMACMLSFGFAGLSQKSVSGKVTDKTSGEPIPGVTVVVDGTTDGVATNMDGMYTLKASEGQTLVFSYIGYTSQRVAVGAGDSYNVQLASGLDLDEVVVTALGISREAKSLGYAVETVGGSSIDKARETNVLNSLKGRAAGVNVQGSSNLGGSSRILIRGNNSVSGNNQPLFVVDGVPLDNSNFTSTNQARGAGGYDYGNAIQDLNPDDIESISVLKGGAASALYGSRGANGVVMVTTKKGSLSSKGEACGVGISVNSGLSFQSVALLPDYQNSYGGGSGPSFSTAGNGDLMPDYGYDGSWGPALDGTMVRHWDSWFDDGSFGELRPWSPNPDNVRDYFETGVTTNNNIAFTGGNEKAAFRMSYTNLNQDGTQVNSNIERNTLAFSGSSNLSDKISAGITGTYVKSQGKGRPLTGYGESIMSQFNQWYQRQLDTERLKNYQNEDGTHRTWNPNDAANGDLTPHYWDNPYWERYENVQTDQRDRIYGGFNLNYKFNDWLSATGRAMTDLYVDRREERYAIGGVRVPEYTEAIRNVTETNTDLILTADKDLSEDLHAVISVGGNRRTDTYKRNISETVGGLALPGVYNLSNSVNAPSVDDYDEKKQVNSLFASASFGYKRYLYIDVTGRQDYSSTLAEGNRDYFYPSVSGALIFSELVDIPALSFGKIRAGWSQVSNDSDDPYRIQQTFSANTGTNLPSYTVPNSVSNPLLGPEQVNTFEIGTELNFFNNRLSADFTYYNSTTEDLITNVSLSGATGFSSATLNAGKMENKGIEVAIDAIPIQKKDFSWGIGVTIASNKNKLLELADGLDNIRLSSLFGIAVEARVGEEYGQIVGTDYVYDANGNKIIDGGYYLSTADVPALNGGATNLGSVFPDFTGGVMTNFNYKGVGLSALFDFQDGGRVVSFTNIWGNYSGILEETAEGNQRETEIVSNTGAEFLGFDDDGNAMSGGVVTQDANIYNHYFLNGGYIINSKDVYDASFIKFREIQLTYQLPSKIFDNNFLCGAALGLYVRNVAILKSNIPNVDPESILSTGNVQGFEGGQLPTERSYGINLNFNF